MGPEVPAVAGWGVYACIKPKEVQDLEVRSGADERVLSQAVQGEVRERGGPADALREEVSREGRRAEGIVVEVVIGNERQFNNGIKGYCWLKCERNWAGG